MTPKITRMMTTILRGVEVVVVPFGFRKVRFLIKRVQSFWSEKEESRPADGTRNEAERSKAERSKAEQSAWTSERCGYN